MTKKDKRIFVKINKEEEQLIEQKMALAHITNKSAYMRKMAIDGFIINVDISDLTEAVRLLRTVSVRVNRAQNIANTTDTSVIHINTIEDNQRVVGSRE